MRFALENLKEVPVVWIVSKKDGQIINSFLSPLLKVEMILQMTLEGHDDIREPFDNLKYLGMFNGETSPF